MSATTRSITATTRAVEGPVAQDRWLIWIDTVEIVVGRDLRRNDADLDASLNAYLNDESALDYANSIRYPSAVSAGLLRLLVCLLAAGVVTVGVLAWFRGGR
jgi:hypothetical protein